MRQMLSGLHELHRRNIIHRDLKPENFLMADQSPDAFTKLADFGFATEVGKELLKDVCGTNYLW